MSVLTTQIIMSVFMVFWSLLGATERDFRHKCVCVGAFLGCMVMFLLTVR